MKGVCFFFYRAHLFNCNFRIKHTSITIFEYLCKKINKTLEKLLKISDSKKKQNIKLQKKKICSRISFKNFKN